MIELLDNPIWNALQTGDQIKNIGLNNLAFYDASIAPFIGINKWDLDGQQNFIHHAPANRTWFLLIADEIVFQKQIDVTLHIPLYQMVCNSLQTVTFKPPPPQISVLNETNKDEMLALATLTKPGPFSDRTIEFGNYHGIFVDGKLVAMGGERMHVANFTEVSAICTHPDYRGQGYAAYITQFLTHSVLQKRQTPFLHVRVENESAINVYQKLGYQIRKTIQFYMLKV